MKRLQTGRVESAQKFYSKSVSVLKRPVRSSGVVTYVKVSKGGRRHGEGGDSVATARPSDVEGRMLVRWRDDRIAPRTSPKDSQAATQCQRHERWSSGPARQGGANSVESKSRLPGWCIRNEQSSNDETTVMVAVMVAVMWSVAKGQLTELWSEC